jgi:hypothetical protein
MEVDPFCAMQALADVKPTLLSPGTSFLGVSSPLFLGVSSPFVPRFCFFWCAELSWLQHDMHDMHELHG